MTSHGRIMGKISRTLPYLAITFLLAVIVLFSSLRSARAVTGDPVSTGEASMASAEAAIGLEGDTAEMDGYLEIAHISDPKGNNGEKNVYFIGSGGEYLEIIDPPAHVKDASRGDRIRFSGLKSKGKALSGTYTVDAQSQPLPTGTSEGQPQTAAEAVTQGADALTAANPITRKVLVLNFNPYINGTTQLSDYESWNNPLTLQNQYVTDVRNASHNYLNYNIVSTQTIRDYPVKKSGFKFTNTSYLGCLSNSSPAYCMEGIDYNKLINDYNLCGQVNSGAVDEVWLWGGPYMGYWESTMAGPGAFWLNSPPVTGTTCSRKLAIMGFSYERGNAEMLEDLGHRVESTMVQVFGGWAVNLNNAWNRFTIYNKELPGKASCGNVHYPYNGLADYDFGNTASVYHRCDDWLNYPSTNATAVNANCSPWGCTHYGYMKYWHTHLPYRSGQTNNRNNNWWNYVASYDSAVQPVSYGEKWYAVENGAYDYNISCGTVTGANEIYIGTNSGCSPAANYVAYLTFPSIQVPRGAYVTDAYIEFIADGPYANVLTENIWITDGTTTKGPVTWPITESWTTNTKKRSPQLNSIVKQLIDSASWTNGKNIYLYMGTPSGTGARRFFAFEREAMAGARLVLVTSSTAPPTPTPTRIATPTPTPTPMTLYPTADAHVSSANSDKNRNFGSSTTLIVDGSPQLITYMKFDLTSLSARSITSATLRLRVTDSSPGTDSIKSTSTGWSEGTITFSNRPALSTLITTFTGGTSGAWKEVNLTSFVNSNKGRVVSFAVDSTNADSLGFNSRDASSSYRPHIIVR